jgi:hypothetical protein
MARFTVLRPVDLARIREFHTRVSEQLHKILVPGGHVLEEAIDLKEPIRNTLMSQLVLVLVGSLGSYFVNRARGAFRTI